MAISAAEVDLWFGESDAVRLRDRCAELRLLTVDEEIDQRPALSEVRKCYEDERFFQDDPAAAEYAYALAIQLRKLVFSRRLSTSPASACNSPRPCLRTLSTMWSRPARR